MRRLLPLLLLTASISALAVPRQLNHQGRLHDSAGAPLTGSHDLTFTLYDASSGGNALWSETQALDFDAGYFSTTLGADTNNGLTDALFMDNDSLYLGLTVDSGTELSSRVQLVAAPFAIVAGRVEGGTVDAEEVSVNGEVVISSNGTIDWSHIANTPDDADSLAALTCDPSQTLAFNGSAWTCANAADHSHKASDIIDGVLSIDRIPVGGDADQVAAGNHTHSAESVGALPSSTTIEDLGGLPDTTTIQDLGGVPADGGTLDGAYEVTGDLYAGAGIKIGDSALLCDDADHIGQLKFDDDGLSVCLDSGWTIVARQGADGSTQQQAALDCKTIKANVTDANSGMYWLDPNGGGTGDAKQMYCDMASDGGGWTLCAQLDVSTATNSQKIAYPTEVSGSYDTANSFVTDCSAFGFSELLFTESWDDSGDKYLVQLKDSGATPSSFYSGSQFNQKVDVQGRYLSGSFNSFAPKEMMWTGNRSCPSGWNSGLGFRLSIGDVGASWSGGNTGCYAHQGNYCQNPVVDIGGHVNGQASPDWAIGGDWSTCQYDGAERRMRGTRSQMFVR